MSFLRRKHLGDMVDRALVQSLANAGILMPAEVRMVYSSGTSASYSYLRDLVNEANIHKTLALAYAATVSARNDVVLLSMETHSQAATLDWAKYNTHLIGMRGGRTFQAHTARVTPSANYTPGWTLSGYNNTWANMRLAHPAGNAGNLVGVELSGHYNYWNNVDLWSPGSTTEGAVAAMISLSLSGGNNYFEGCTIGGDSRMRAAANCILNINTNGVQNVFKDCTFMYYTNSADTFFIYCASGAGIQNRWTLFDNCTFIAYSVNWGTASTVGVKYQYSGDGHRLIFKDCGFVGIADVVADGYRNNCQFIGGNTYLGATAGTGMSAASA